ncbi:Crp/Fnr family transcriptional regulator [Hyphomicrobium sp. ghe19]|uniref:Crp/Fnr family transcriptional regulator n=1 Tax=Hyphomicrobium sp. ghe19 TaxID=2682968 RepID=UPI0013673041|nr:Nitrogen fixation regulation protein FixK [Hyphomicrobium sp. ghe19]
MFRPDSEYCGDTALILTAPARQSEVGNVRTLARDELLFETGDLKTNVYRVEAGALCISRARRDGTMEIVEYALAGDLVGIGFLQRHVCNARASVRTVVRCLRLDATDKLIASDAHNKARFDEAVEREFVFRRESLARSSRHQPMVRLAAFLTAVSRRSKAEGADPTFIDDTVNCGVIADFLGLDIEALTVALTELEARGLVEAAPPHGLRLKDLNALEAVADGHGMTSGSPALDDVLRAALQ